MTAPENLNMMTGYHQPVMLQEVLSGLAIQSGGIYVDATFGGGGHAAAILARLNTAGKLIAFDQDEAALQNHFDDKRLQLVPENFRHLYRFLKLYRAIPVNGILADLGVSSYQFDTPERGFSTRFEGKLDMRMDKRNTLTASKVLQQYSPQQLHKLFEQYGEITNARTLAGAIATARQVRQISTTGDLINILQPLSKGNPMRYYAQVFQALRIEVNDELGALKDFLQQTIQVLKPGGRLVVISFHSLEDKIVKNFMKTGQCTSDETDMLADTGNKSFKIITKKPLTASPEEVKINPRARSAKLRIAEKL